MDDRESQAATRFEQRLNALRSDLSALGGDRLIRDVLVSARRVESAFFETRSLLEGNMNVLFGDESADVRQQLTNWLDHAREQIRRALAEEHDVDAIRQRLTMAVALTDMVVQRMREKMEVLRSKHLL
jgi:hypothetical protein